MKNTRFVFIILAILIIVGILVYFYVTNNNINSSGVTGTRTSLDIDDNSLASKEDAAKNKLQTAKSSNKETTLSTFSTKILDDSPGRLENIRITCGIINNTVVNPGETFSFNEIVGQPSTDRGYKEAPIIIDGEHETGIGGGNCQVSSTLYNAVLSVPNLTIIERNAHGLTVAYVPEGKDAAVSYGSLDLKFRNDNSYKIRVSLESNDENIFASIFKIED